MTEIKISNLHPSGSELFEDPESFLDELRVEEIDFIVGGLTQFNQQFTRKINNNRSRGRIGDLDAILRRIFGRKFAKFSRRNNNVAYTFQNTINK